MTKPSSQSPTAQGRRRPVTVASAATALACALFVGACGSSGSSSQTTESSTDSGNGVAQESPTQIVSAAQTALRSANGYVAAGTFHENGASTKLRLVSGGPSKLEVEVRSSGTAAQVIVAKGSGYIRANRAYWIKQSGGSTTPASKAKAKALSDRWIELPAGESQKLVSSFGEFSPNTLAKCLGEGLGKLSSAGTTTVNGKSAVVVRAAGNVPGSGPGTLAVATTGPAFPLRVTSTGPTKPGGKVDACNTGKGDDGTGSITLSQFNSPPAVKVPTRHVLKITTGGTASE